MKRLALIAAVAVASCGQSEAPASDAAVPAVKATATASPAPAPVTPTPVVKALSDDDRGRVCKAAIAVLNGRDPSIMRVIKDEAGLTRVRYTRDDGTVWTNECRVEPDRVSWRIVDSGGPGRWRTEDTITYAIDGDTVSVRLSMDGEVVSEKEYTF